MFTQCILLCVVGFSVVLAAPVAKENSKLTAELSPNTRISAEKVLAFLVQHGLMAPEKVTPLLLKGIRKHKDWIYQLLSGGANVSIDAEGEIQAWQSGPGVYVVQNADGTMEQKVAEVNLPVLPPKPWARVRTNTLPVV